MGSWNITSFANLSKAKVRSIWACHPLHFWIHQVINKKILFENWNQRYVYFQHPRGGGTASKKYETVHFGRSGCDQRSFVKVALSIGKILTKTKRVKSLRCWTIEHVWLATAVKGWAGRRGAIVGGAYASHLSSVTTKPTTRPTTQPRTQPIIWPTTWHLRTKPNP